jgi:dUTP pyrophosphatase
VTGSGAPDVEVLIRRLDPALPLPAYSHPGDAGADLVTAVDIDLGPGERLLVPTGIAIALPAGYAAFVHPRSGLAARFGLGIVNAPGTVDAGYRGEIKVLVINHDPVQRVQLQRGHRIAQLVVQRVERVEFHEVQLLPGSARGEGGYGSTGGFLDREPLEERAASAGLPGIEVLEAPASTPAGKGGPASTPAGKSEPDLDAPPFEERYRPGTGSR